MPIAIATLGKFVGPPTPKASAVYGGGTSAGVKYIEKPHRFPIVKINKLEREDENININILDIEESQYD